VVTKLGLGWERETRYAMDGRSLPPLQVTRPWPTGIERSRRVVRAIVVLGTMQFVLSAFQLIAPAAVMFWMWMAGAGLFAVATAQIETYLERRRRMFP
jgi:hypothetical protein